MSFYEEEELIGKVYDRRIAGRLLSYLRPYRTQVVISVLLMLVVAGLELVPTLLVKYAIDEQITPGRTDQLGKVALLFLGTLLLGFMMRFVQMYLTWWVGQRFMVDLRMQLFSHIQHLSVSYFDRNPVGRLVTRLTGDIQQIEMVISQGIIQILTNLLMVTAIVVA
ncbi:MAG: ABC transporter ATP-binding protein, partial [Dehalococcoidia bacterium]|nr:ABC transporter ATP-binding protein [Dehalococcoidia bacterium]